MKRLLLAIITTIIAVSGFAFSSSDNGTTGAEVLNLPAGARASAMGEAFTSIADDSTAVYWNPAGLNTLKGASATFMHSIWFGDTSYEWASIAMPLGNDRIGIGVKYLNYGSIQQTDSTSLTTGSFSPADLVIQASYAGKLADLNWGITLKYASLTITSTASAFCLDLGVIQPFKLGDTNLAGGIGIYNLGFGGKFISDTFNLPMSIKAGISGNVMKGLLVAIDGALPSDSSIYATIGAEYKLKFASDISGALRCGYTLKNPDVAGLTAGAGVVIGNISIDYAYVPFGDLGTTHTFSISFAFDSVQKQQSPLTSQ